MQVSSQFHVTPALPRARSPEYPPNKRLSEPQRQSESCKEEETFLTNHRIKQFVTRPAHSLVTVPTEVLRLPYLL
jgi:hypothetical protein